MMEGVVLHGTGTLARLQGYTAGGKTGSAQIFDPVCRCYKHVYNSSFAGFAPVASPAIVVVVTINGASVFGGAVAAPVFREVATAALRLLDVPKDLPDTPPLREDEPVDLTDLAIADLGSPAAAAPGAGDPGARGERSNFGGRRCRTSPARRCGQSWRNRRHWVFPVELDRQRHRAGAGASAGQRPAAGRAGPDSVCAIVTE